MKHVITASATILLFGTALLLNEKHRKSASTRTVPEPSIDAIQTIANTGDAVRAAGRIEGRTEQTELRVRVAEQIREIHVSEGMTVVAGAPLLSLDADRLDAVEGMENVVEPLKSLLQFGSNQMAVSLDSVFGGAT
mgnify:CR=1 FL=1